MMSQEKKRNESQTESELSAQARRKRARLDGVAAVVDDDLDVEEVDVQDPNLEDQAAFMQQMQERRQTSAFKLNAFKDAVTMHFQAPNGKARSVEGTMITAVEALRNPEFQRDVAAQVSARKALGSGLDRDFLEKCRTESFGQTREELLRARDDVADARQLSQALVNRAPPSKSTQQVRDDGDKERVIPSLPNGDPEPMPMTAYVQSRMNSQADNPQERQTADAAAIIQKRMHEGMSAVMPHSKGHNVHVLYTCLKHMMNLEGSVLRSLRNRPDTMDPHAKHPEARKMREIVAEAMRVTETHPGWIEQASKHLDGLFAPHIADGRKEVIARNPELPPPISRAHFERMLQPQAYNSQRQRACVMQTSCVSRTPLGPTATCETRRCEWPGMLGEYLTPEQLRKGETPAQKMPCILCILFFTEHLFLAYGQLETSPTFLLNYLTFETGTGSNQFPPDVMLEQYDGPNAQRWTGIMDNCVAFSKLDLHPGKVKGPNGEQRLVWELSFQDFGLPRTRTGRE